MAQITLNSTGVASNGSLVLQSNGTTAAVTIDTSQRAAFVAGTAALPAITTTGDTNTGIFFPAGDTIAFSEGGAESMRIDSSGNVGIGTNSANARLEIAKSSGVTLRLNDISTNYWDISNNSNLTFVRGGTEYARIDSSGNVGIGTSSPATALSVQNARSNTAGTGWFTYTDSATAGRRGMRINTSNGYCFDYYDGSAWSEQMQIDSSGNLLVGTTSTVAGAAFVVSKSVNDYLARFINSNATAYGVVVNYSGASPNSTGQEFFRCVDSTADRMLVRSNGGIANYSANDVNLSDRREKTNFAPAKSYLDVICAIPVQTFNYIDQNMEDDGGLTLGVVAQDVQAVAPELVMESNWASKDEEPKMRLSIYQTDLQYALMKCIQEQQALITQLQADVAALKGTA